MNKLPKEIINKIFYFLSSPIAEIYKQNIIDTEIREIIMLQESIEWNEQQQQEWNIGNTSDQLCEFCGRYDCDCETLTRANDSDSETPILLDNNSLYGNNGNDNSDNDDSDDSDSVNDNDPNTHCDCCAEKWSECPCMCFNCHGQYKECRLSCYLTRGLLIDINDPLRNFVFP